ncbi:Flagellar, putative [Syntrophomonas zehnderi OL-4]|uniref:Flagellar, putative n=1 Tax=Syntrophomonas zehnderi OL-4 TaxID=690567 RepID=A0A0E3W397_9FIRM|nr:TIGR02530 family flagellar biosynthesis protein [Syntrophomonas zehnderi]CFX65113.1 Flagellar, putative [Syntrophomonas zehnderi OL-4]
MDNRIYFPQPPINPVPHNKPTRAKPVNAQTPFSQVLDQKLQGELKFSQHARERLQARNIKLSDDDLSKLNEAVDKARTKGSRDSLILMNDMALVVSVKNNTVITAVDQENIKENVFTNIDSAVII